MKKNLLFVFTMLCALSFFTACSDDDNSDSEVPVLLKGETAFSAEKLSLKYGDSPLLGKAITFSTEDGKTGTIKMEGVFDPSIIKDLLPSKNNVVPALAPGVIPGEVVTMFNVNLTQDGNKYTFEGTDSNNGREMKYAGTVDSTSMTLAVNVTMPKNDLLGTWNLAKQDMTTGKSPVILSWISTSPGITIPGMIDEPWPTKDAAALLGNIFLSPMLTKYLHTVTFQEDGNIVASYSAAGKEDENSVSPVNLAQYYIKDGKLYLQLNIDMILATIAANKTKTKALDASVILQFASLLSEGIPLNCEIKDGTAAIYADKDLIFCGSYVYFLSRCLPVQINRDKRIQYIRNPGGHSRAEVAVDGEGRCDGGEEDVGETQGQSDADVQPHASFDLAGRERGSDGGQDEGGHDGGKTFVVFDLERLDIADPSFLLAVDIRGQFGRSHRLAVIDRDQEVRRDDCQCGVHAAPFGDMFAHPVEVADHVVDQRPIV